LGEDAGVRAMNERFADTFDKRGHPKSEAVRPEAMTTAQRWS